MSEFFKYTGESVLRSPNILVRRTDIVSIQDFCVSALGYKNINSVHIGLMVKDSWIPK